MIQTMNDYITKQTKIKTEDIISDILITQDAQEKYMNSFDQLSKNFSDLFNCFWSIPPSDKE